jgi:hypothetical protein
MTRIMSRMLNRKLREAKHGERSLEMRRNLSNKEERSVKSGSGEDELGKMRGALPIDVEHCALGRWSLMKQVKSPLVPDGRCGHGKVLGSRKRRICETILQKPMKD